MPELILSVRGMALLARLSEPSALGANALSSHADDSATDTRDGHDEDLPGDTNSVERDQNLTDSKGTLFGTVYTFPGNKRKVLEPAFL